MPTTMVRAAATSGMDFTGLSLLDGMKANQVLSQTYGAQSHLSQDEIDAINCPGSGVQNSNGGNCFCQQ